MSDDNGRDYLDPDKRARDIDALRDKADFAPMSDIQPTEAKREEAQRRVAEVKMEACGLPTHYEDGDLVDDIQEKKAGSYGTEFTLNPYEACARVRQFVARECADAVKAERKRVGIRVDEMVDDAPTWCDIESYKMGYKDASEHVRRILSDDKEALRKDDAERSETLQEYLDRQDGADIDLEHGSN